MARRESADVRRAKSLKREYDMWVGKANRPGAPNAEVAYLRRCAAGTANQIDWGLLSPKKKRDEFKPW